MNQRSSKATQLALTGMFTAIIVVLSQLAIPMPSGVPITLQTFGIALCGYILGYRYGSASYFIYLLLGATGLPVFAGLSGGLSKLVGITGGFLWGFFFIVLLCGLASKIQNKPLQIIFGVIGLLLCHICGIIQFSFTTGNSFIASSLLVSIPYLLKDIASIVIAYLLSVTVKTVLKKATH